MSPPGIAEMMAKNPGLAEAARGIASDPSAMAGIAGMMGGGGLGGGGGGGGGGMPAGLAGLMQNPAIAKMAQSVMSNPAMMQQVMGEYATMQPLFNRPAVL